MTIALLSSAPPSDLVGILNGIINQINAGAAAVTPGGTNGQIQYNNAGALGGVSGATSNGTTLTLTTPVINGAPTGTGVGSGATVSTLVLRDGAANARANNFIYSATSTVSASGTTILTVASTRVQILTGTQTQTFQLPSALSLTAQTQFSFNNNSTGNLSVVDAGSNAICTVVPGGYVNVIVTNTGSANGVWDNHSLAPAGVNWGTTILAPNLPTSSSGLPTGALWNNSGVVSVA